MGNDIYFPAMNGPVECSLCEAAECHSRDKYQRGRRDFTITSGRCPKLPGYSEPVALEWRKAEAARWPMVHVVRNKSGKLAAWVTPAGQSRARRLYCKCGKGYETLWYFNGTYGRIWLRIDSSPQSVEELAASCKQVGSLRAEVVGG